jgi:hypothetical protein
VKPRKSLRVNGCRILPKYLRRHDGASERFPGSDIEAARALADYAATVRARRTDREVITIRFDHVTVTDAGVVESWTFHITTGRYANVVGGYTDIVEYDLPITDTEAEVAKVWLEAEQ